MKEKILRLLYPEKCPVCAEPLTKEDRYENNPFICKTCYKNAGFADGARCIRCAKPLEDETEPFCKECKEKERYFDRGFALLRHDETAKNVIYGFKFRYELDNIRFPALEAALRYGKEILQLKTQAFIPVPLHKSRKRERGYNQARLLAEEISKYMLLLYGSAPPCDSTYLLRKKKTRYQRDLDPGYRAENVKDAFCVAGDSEKDYKFLCVVDDIYTTGSTIDSCAKTLKASGCSKVFFLVVSIVG